ASTYIDATVDIGPDTVVHPQTFLRGRTRIGAGCEIGPSSQLDDTVVGDRCRIGWSVLEEATLAEDVRVGPFAHLRPGARLGRGPLQLCAGNSNRPLAIEIAAALGMRLGNALVGTFRNGEVRIRVEDNVRGADVFVLQSLCPPIHHHIWELLLMLDALRRASARRITAVVPYYAYARQERKTAGREPISARVLADVITTA